MTVFDALEKSRTFNRFKNDLIDQIPRIPNDRESLQALRLESPTDLLIVYLCWRLRHVETRSRKVTGCHRLWFRPSLWRMRSNVKALLHAVEAGHDLTPYLSLRAQRHGFVLDRPEVNIDWEHKDFLLNVMGLHHFHLGTRREPRGQMARTNEVLFAFVGRDTFEIIGLFDHAVFEANGDVLTDERRRIWATYENYQTRRRPAGGAYIGGYGGLGITLAGTPMIATLVASEHVKIIKKVDPRLEDLEFLTTLWGKDKVPPKRKLRWKYNHLTLGLQDTVSGRFFPLRPA